MCCEYLCLSCSNSKRACLASGVSVEKIHWLIIMNATYQWHLPEALLVWVEAAICCRRACLASGVSVSRLSCWDALLATSAMVTLNLECPVLFSAFG